jgi:hypothetical protein
VKSKNYEVPPHVILCILLLLPLILLSTPFCVLFLVWSINTHVYIKRFDFWKIKNDSNGRRRRNFNYWNPSVFHFPMNTCSNESLVSRDLVLIPVVSQAVGIISLSFISPRLRCPHEFELTSFIFHHLRQCNQKFPDWVDNEIYAYNNKH